MSINLHNTLTKKKEVFEAINKNEVRMYSCGPTVYNYLHIGNLRAYVFADILKRTLLYNGYKVKHIMNVTDIGHLTSDADEGEDKMVKALKREGKPMTLEGLKEVGLFYFEKFKEDFEKINILPPEKYVFASDEIPAQIEMIEKLMEAGFAYKTSDGIYFETEKLPSYGRLGLSASESHSRIGINADKRNVRDFALWKFGSTSLTTGTSTTSTTGSENSIGFEAPFGRGFPGWHIECSAMSMKYLGEQFDIHTGGVDHIPVHHNNEIAQSEAITGKILANYWLHNEHITIADEKMAKSGENFLTINYLIENGVDSIAYRYWLLTSRYSTRIDYSLDAIKAAQTAYGKIKSLVALKLEANGTINEDYKNKFTEAMNDDLDTPKALSVIWELIKDENISPEDKKATLLDFDNVLGLGLADAKNEEIEIPYEVKELLEKRKIAKESRDFALADLIRKNIENKGFFVSDQKDGSQSLTKN